jgi:GDP-L-fucose synthase
LFNDSYISLVDESSEVSIGEVAKMIADAFQLEHGIVLDETKSDGQYKKTASNKKLRGYLPDFQFMPLKDAIERTVQWFNLNYNTARK